MGGAFRSRFDKETFYALLKRSPHWEAWGEQMVRSTTEPYSRATTFHVRLARRKGTAGVQPQDVVDSFHTVSAEVMQSATEEVFAEIGQHMADHVNAKVEELYMAID